LPLLFAREESPSLPAAYYINISHRCLDRHSSLFDSLVFIEAGTEIAHASVEQPVHLKIALAASLALIGASTWRILLEAARLLILTQAVSRHEVRSYASVYQSGVSLRPPDPLSAALRARPWPVYTFIIRITAGCRQAHAGGPSLRVGWVGFELMRLKKHFRHVLRLWSHARGLSLSIGDTVRFFASDYGPRVGLAPRVFTISMGNWRVLLRSNAVDWRILYEVFAGVYRTEPSQKVARIMDLGANIGLSALYFHSRYPEASIACVEPSPGNLNILSRVLALNKLPATIFDCAIGPESGSATLYDTTDPSCCNLLGSGRNGDKWLVVRQMTVPEIMSSLAWDRIDILKIDIEGYERVLLRQNADWLSRVSCIVGEIHDGYDLADLRADLEPYGFDTTQRSPATKYGQITFVAVRASA